LSFRVETFYQIGISAYENHYSSGTSNDAERQQPGKKQDYIDEVFQDLERGNYDSVDIECLLEEHLGKRCIELDNYSLETEYTHDASAKKSLQNYDDSKSEDSCEQKYCTSDDTQQMLVKRNESAEFYSEEPDLPERAFDKKSLDSYVQHTSSADLALKKSSDGKTSDLCKKESKSFSERKLTAIRIREH
jgi:hypothetical protein